jgi:hypothetical protein
MSDYDDGEGGLEAIFSILYGMVYLFIVLPLAWLAKKMGLLDD